MKSETRRAAWAEINLDAIKNNYKKLKKLSGSSEIIAAIKADAYGHGAIKVAWELIKEGVDYLAVATLNEAVEIRSNGIKTPVVLLSPAPRKNIKDILDLNLITVVTTYEDAHLLSELVAKQAHPKKPEIFIAIDSGMGRIGYINNRESIAQICKILALQNIKVKGLFSHFASSGEENDPYTLNQIDTFLSMKAELEKIIAIPQYMTIANSAAIINYPQALFDAVRPGILLYGLYPSDSIKEKLSFTPAMSIKANIVFIKTVPPGFSVSYNSTFTTSKESKIASLSLGYADGLPRLLSNIGRVIVNGEYAPIVGNICMDQTLIDVTHIPDVKEYDEVVILGTQGDKTITADEIGELTGTINYEIATRFGQRLPKLFISE